MKSYFHVEKLKTVYREKKENNAKYSMRAFANFLNINAGTLSSVVKQKRSLPLNHLDNVSKALKLTKEEVSLFKQSIMDFNQEKAQKRKTTDRKKRRTEVLVPDKYYQIISDWEFSAIFSLMELDEFEYSAEWISKRLNLKVSRVSEIIEIIDACNLLEFNEKTNKHELRDIDFTTTDDIESKALHESHEQNLDLAKRKLNELPVNERYFYSYTFSFREKDFQDLKKIISNFHNKIDNINNDKDLNDAVYQVNVQAFPLTNKV